MTSTDDSESTKIYDDESGSHSEDVITKLSLWSVADTVTRLLAAAAARELKVFAVIDHSGEAADAGLHLRETKLGILEVPRRHFRHPPRSVDSIRINP